MRWIGPVLFALLLAGSWALTYAGGRVGPYGWLFVADLLPLLGAAVLAVTLLWALVRRRLSAASIATIALALVALWPLGWSFGLPGMAYPANVETSRPAVTIRVPSDHAMRVGWGGDTLEHNYHAATSGQRWAYDLVIEPALHGGTKLESYGCFGTPVLAPIAGTVHIATDGLKDMAIGEELADVGQLLGNHVVLKLHTGTYLVLAHMKNGSVTVKKGDVVTEGQQIGQCGNSGNTSEPHLHIHHQRQDPLYLGGDLHSGVNYSEGLPLFFRDHGGPKMPHGGLLIEGDKAVATGDVIKHKGPPAPSQ